MHEPICAVCGNNSGWIADPVYGWVQCANCNDERTKPKPLNCGLEQGSSLLGADMVCVGCGALVPAKEGRFVYLSFFPLKVACLTCAPTKQEPPIRDNRHLFKKPADSSCLDFPEFTSDEDFFDHVAEVGLDV